MDERSVFDLTPVMPRANEQWFTGLQLWVMGALILVMLAATLVRG